MPAGPMPLRRWLWRSYLRSAIIPLLVIEIGFLAVFWINSAHIYDENVATVGALSQGFLEDVARREALAIGTGLAGTSRNADLLARQTLTALDGSFRPSPQERSRYASGPRGGFHTLYDNGTTASFYSAITPIGPAQREKVWRLAALDPLMIALIARTLGGAAPA